MKRIPPRRPRLRLAAESYERLRMQVVKRDGWKCQNCGSPAKLQIHHKEFRSQSGDDDENNLITLCVDCHLSLHLHVL
jgi:5-methylcytosine-specific restriction endonuclease McrA